MDEKKIVFKVFLPDALGEEEIYLSAMSRKGWHLRGVWAYGYVFQRGKPGDFIYRRDFHKKSTHNRADYLQLFSDLGWDLVAQFSVPFGIHYYFRGDTGCDVSAELFTDRDSRIGVYMRLAHFIALIGGIVLPFFVALLIAACSLDDTRLISFSSGAITGGGIAFVCMFTRCLIKIRRLKNSGI